MHHSLSISRGSSNDSKVFAKEVGEDHHRDKEDQNIVRQAAIGLAKPTTAGLRPKKPDLKPSSSSVRREALENVGLLGRLRAWLQAVQWDKVRLRCMLLGCLFESIYTMVTTPLRVGFLFDPWNTPIYRTMWTDALTAFMVGDIVAGVFRIWFFRRQLQTMYRDYILWWVPRVSTRISVASVKSLASLRNSLRSEGASIGLSAGFSTQSMRGDQIGQSFILQRHGKATKMSSWESVFVFVSTAPWELICLVDYNWLHLVGLARYAQAAFYFSSRFTEGVIKQYPEYSFIQHLSFSRTALSMYVAASGLYLCHVAAAGYMFCAHWECGLFSTKCDESWPPQSWVIRDYLDDGNLWRHYFRSLYWGAKTITTLGQGDLVPATMLETAYRIIIQFLGGLWATAALMTYEFYYFHEDINMEANVSTRLEQSMKFLAFRHAPTQLQTRVRTFFHHLEKSRNGVEESVVLADLPSHYRLLCSNHIKYRCLRRIAFFRRRDGAFLRTILNLMVQDFYIPNQQLVAFKQREQMLMVSIGEIRILDEKLAPCGRLTPGNVYCEHALYRESYSTQVLIADTFCEIWWLPADSFRRALRSHYSRMKRASIVLHKTVHNIRASRISIPRISSIVASTISADRDLAPQDASDHGGTALKKLVSRLVTDAADMLSRLPVWRLHNSRFQIRWRQLECTFLLFTLVEVPHHIAFQPSMAQYTLAFIWFRRLDFALCWLAEMFFLVDWYLRSHWFVRTTNGTFTPGSTTQLGFIGFIVQKSEIFRHYRENDAVALDVLANLPVSLLFDTMHMLSMVADRYPMIHLVRLLRLIRLRNLKATMKLVMVERSVRPATRLLMYMMVLAFGLGHIAACVFYFASELEASKSNFASSAAVTLGSINASVCLRDAAAFGNCTWTISDRSTFDIDAPYLRSFYWSMVILTNVGYGDIVPLTTLETVIAIIWIYFGTNINYFLSRVFCRVFAQWSVLSTLYHRRLEEINVVLTSLTDVPPVLKSTIRRYYETKWALNGCVAPETDVVNYLPQSLQREVSSALYSPLLKRCEPIAEFAEDTFFIDQVARRCRTEVFLQDMLITRTGHLATEFFIIQTGEVELVLPPVREQTVVADDASGSQRGSSRIASNGQRRSSITELANVLKLTRLWRQRPKRYLQIKPLPLAALKEGDWFGQESMCSRTERNVYQSHARVASCAQVVVLRRSDYFALEKTFPRQVVRLVEMFAHEAYEKSVLHNKLRHNFFDRDKMFKMLGVPTSLYGDPETRNNNRRERQHRVLDPDSFFIIWWTRMYELVLVYNFVVIIFRIAFLQNISKEAVSWFMAVDYAIDVFLLFDIYLKWTHFGFREHGEKVLNRQALRQRYTHRFLVIDVCSMLPLYFQSSFFVMSLERLPRLLRSGQLVDVLDNLHTKIQEQYLHGNTFVLHAFELSKFVLIFLASAHYCASLYYLLGVLQTGSPGSADNEPISWVTVDHLITEHPNEPLVHYMRSLYWCLSTFTLVCNGDIWSYNTLETVFAMLSAIGGWLFIGLVIEKINTLALVLRKDQYAQEERVEDFEQYAKRKRISGPLRQRAMESLELTTECWLELQLPKVFHDLPHAIRIQLYDELYGKLLRNIPELSPLSVAQLEALASVMYLEVYLHGDMIYESGCVGTRLYVMKDGRAEVFSPVTKMVFAPLDNGALFGDITFFLPTVRKSASIRAVRSCQVLQLDRPKWNTLWPAPVRRQLEAKLSMQARDKYLKMARSFMNITKNFHLKRSYSSKLPRPRTILKAELLHVVASAQTPTEAKNNLAKLINKGLNHGHSPLSSKHNSGVGIGMRSEPFSRRLSAGFSASFTRRSSDSNVMHLPDFPVGAANLRELLFRSLTRPPDVVSRRTSSEAVKVLADMDVRWRRHDFRVRVLRSVETKWQQIQEELIRWERPTRPRRASITFPIGGWDHPLVLAPEPSAPRRPRRLSMEVSRKPAVPVRRGSIDLLQHRPMMTAGIENESKTTDSRMSVIGDIRLSKDSEVVQSPPSPTLDLLPKPPEASFPSITRLRTMLLSSWKAVAPTTSSRRVVPQEKAGSSAATTGTSGDTTESKPTSAAPEPKKSSAISNANSTTAPDNAFQIWVEQPSPSHVFVEGSRFRRLWDLYMLASTCYCIIVMPFRIAFLSDVLDRPDYHNAALCWFVAEYILTDAVAAVDFYMRKNYFSFILNGEEVADIATIRAHYWRHGTYLTDFLALLPFELVLLVVGAACRQTSAWVTWQAVSLCRSTKILRGWALHSLRANAEHFFVYDVKVSWLRTNYFWGLWLCVDLAVATHWVACIFYGLSVLGPVHASSWLTVKGMLSFEGLEDREAVSVYAIGLKYLRTYHFGIGTITTVCYGDIVPRNVVENLANILVMLLSIAFYSINSGTFYTLLEIAYGKRAEYEERVSQVGHYMLLHHFPARLWKQMQVYFAMSWQESNGMKEEEMLRGVCNSVKRELALFVRAHLINHVQLFVGCDERFSRAVVTALQRKMFVRNDPIVQRGDLARTLYIIESGLVSIRMAKKRKSVYGVAVALAGERRRSMAADEDTNNNLENLVSHKGIKGPFEWFGHHSLLFGTPQAGTCVALSVCSIFVLTHESYEAILLEFPSYRSRNVREWGLMKRRAQPVGKAPKQALRKIN
ncbi:TPA: hypothetical protein N0F65_003756 [Lagenidium giganteum]|uniref:Cyclic nucleotide-binding domain-containing protein n=1 Tax=Lagenidium giganteum TaxID=4803 RepID=A0AAV2YHK2_9STRA|nr:TPA: hypothetical protein N0F65_003756 [Lagenidium giganteum]